MQLRGIRSAPSTSIVGQELGERTAEIRNLIYNELGEYRAMDLDSKVEKEGVSEHLKNAINQLLVTGQVEALFFEDYLISF